MAGKPLGLLIEELRESLQEMRLLITTLTGRMDVIDRDLEQTTTTNAETATTIGDLKTSIALTKQQVEEMARWRAELGPVVDLKTDIAVVKRDVQELRKGSDEWGHRIWGVAMMIVGAIVAGAIGYYFRGSR
jgi:chromosome segregation ATPase